MQAWLRPRPFALRLLVPLLLFLGISTLLAQNPVEPLTVEPADQVQPAAMQPELSPPPAAGLRIGTGDLLEISVYAVPELDQSVRVNSAGDVSLSLIGTVEVAGLSAEEAQARIEEKYAGEGFLKAPHVTVFVKEFATQGVSIMGEVAKPGIYPLMGVRRIPDVIAAAGGLTPKAGREALVTRKKSPNEPILIALEEDGQPALQDNIEIYPGDTVVISKAGLIYVVGEVGRPGGFVMENNTNFTVLQAIAMAQGLGKNPRLGGARLIRRTDAGLQEIPIPLKDILSAKSPDLTLQQEDIVFVPASFGKGIAKKTLETVVQTASSAIIYRR